MQFHKKIVGGQAIIKKKGLMAVARCLLLDFFGALYLRKIYPSGDMNGTISHWANLR